jgi:hypothetical protein
VPADVAQGSRSQQRIRQRVADDISVGVTREPRLLGELQPPEPQRSGRVPSVGVEPEPAALFSHRVLSGTTPSEDPPGA